MTDPYSTADVTHALRRFGPLTIGEIAGAIGCSRDRAKSLVSDAEQAGLVKRSRTSSARWDMTQ